MNVNIIYGFFDKATIDANLHPSIQEELCLIYLKNNDEHEPLLIYTNSIHVLGCIILANAYEKHNIPNDLRGKFKGFAVKRVRHFYSKPGGKLVEGKYYKDMVSNDNLLNNLIEQQNKDYGKLLDLVLKLENENDN
jgi:hypothetical protein